MINDFEYFAPTTVEEALALLAQYKGESKIIAGGQSLLIPMRQGLVNAKYIIDIKGIASLDYINHDAKEGLRIGALTSHWTIETSPLIRNGFGVLAEMEQMLASVQTRNWGTIGGNLCHSDPAGDPAPILITLDGQLKIASLRGERTVAVDAFCTDYFETVLEPDEMLIEIQVSNPPPYTGTAYTKFSQRVGDMAIVGAAVSITLSQTLSLRTVRQYGACTDARIALGAVASVPMRAKEAESVLVGQEINDSLLEEAAQAAADESSPISDIHASEDERRELIKVLVKRVTREALEKVQAV